MLLRIGFLLVLCSVGCHPLLGRSYTIAHCERAYREGPRQPAPPPPDPEFAKLHANHSYFSIGTIGPFAAHFAVRFGCVEQAEDFYGVVADGTIEVEGRGWGGIAVPEGTKHDPIPADQQASARAIAARHAADYTGASAGDVVYLGSWRAVSLTERVPQSPPGDPLHRTMSHWTMALHANADLTALVDKPSVEDGGDTMMCWKDFDYVSCHDQYWVDVDAPPTTAPQLTSLLAHDDALITAALLAAREKRIGKPDATIEAILAK